MATYQMYWQITNNCSHHLNMHKGSLELEHGEWTPTMTPPLEIRAGRTEDFQAESDGFLTGTEGYIDYYIEGHGTIKFSWDFDGGPFSHTRTWDVRFHKGDDELGLNIHWNPPFSGDAHGSCHVTIDNHPTAEGYLLHHGSGKYIVRGENDSLVLHSGRPTEYDRFRLECSGQLHHMGKDYFVVIQNGPANATYFTPFILWPSFGSNLYTLEQGQGGLHYLKHHKPHTYVVADHARTSDGTGLVVWSGYGSEFNAFSFEE